MAISLHVAQDCLRGINDDPGLTVLSMHTRTADDEDSSRLVVRDTHGRRFLVTVEAVADNYEIGSN